MTSTSFYAPLFEKAIDHALRPLGTLGLKREGRAKSPTRPRLRDPRGGTGTRRDSGEPLGPRIPLALPDCSSAELFEFIQSDFGRIYLRGNNNDIHILLNDECDPAQWKPMLKPC